MLTARQLVNDGLTSEILAHNKYPPEIIQLIIDVEKNNHKNKTRYIMDELIYTNKLKKLKKEFEVKIKNDINDTGESYNPFDSEFSHLIESASKILTKHHLNQIFWKKILGNTYLNLNEYQYQGGPNSNNYQRTEHYFKILVNKLNFIDADDDYLDNNQLYELLIEDTGIINNDEND